MKKEMVYIAIIFLLLAVLIMTNFNKLTGFAAFETNEKTNFSVYTAAVCVNNTDNLSCRDEIFIRCEDIEYQIPTNVSLAHESGWEDPRKKEENAQQK